MIGKTHFYKHLCRQLFDIDYWEQLVILIWNKTMYYNYLCWGPLSNMA